MENLVALYSRPDCSGQLGIDTAVGFLKSAVARFEAAAAKLSFSWNLENLRHTPKHGKDVAKDIQTFVKDAGACVLAARDGGLYSPVVWKS